MLGENEVMESEMDQLKANFSKQGDHLQSRLEEYEGRILQYQSEEKIFKLNFVLSNLNLPSLKKKRSWQKKRRKVFKIIFMSLSLVRIMRPERMKKNMKEQEDNRLV